MADQHTPDSLPTHIRGVRIISLTDSRQWREWLLENHEKEQSVWILYYKKKSGIPSITYQEALDQALCFGWIDSTVKSIDDKSYFQYFSKRRPTSSWSKVNRIKVEKLIQSGEMTPAGMRMIELAKAKGRWETAGSEQENTIPDRLTNLLNTNQEALQNWSGFPAGIRKSMINYILAAKTEPTIVKRCERIFTMAQQNNRNLYL